MSKFPLVSVIIVNYNGKKFIGQCLDSLLKVNYPCLEVIVVDNASTDGSFEYLKKRYGNHSKIKLLRSDRQLYFTGGSNLGAKTAQGKKLVFLNSDTVVDQNFIKELVKFVGQQKKYLVQPKILFYRHQNTIDNVGGRYSFFGFGYGIGRGEKDCGQYNQNSQVDYVNGTCFMIDKKFFWELGGFDDWYKLYYEDIDLNLRAKKRGGKSWYCYKSLVFHKGSLTIKKTTKNELLLFHIRKNRIETVIKNFQGIKKIIKLSGLIIIYIYLIIKDLLIFKKLRSVPTIKSLIAVLNYEHKLLIEKIRFKELKKFIGKKNFTLLDLGCGEGAFLKLALNQGIKGLGIDLNPPPHPNILVSPIEKLNFKKRFRAITLFHTLEHTENPFQILKKIKTLLQKEGILVIETPLIGNLSEKFLQKNYFAYLDPTHKHFFTKNELFSLVNKSGFKIKKRGSTFLEFPFYILTSSFRASPLKGLGGIVFFFPLKILSLMGVNEEIVRLYCQPKN